jgi:HEAT repeat protein
MIIMENFRNDINADGLCACQEPADALRKFRAPLIAYLISSLEEKNKWVRVMAIEMLGSVGDLQTVETLAPFLVDGDPDIRTISARAFYQIQGQSGTPVFTEQGGCGNCMIRLVAEEALKNQKGADPGRMART